MIDIARTIDEEATQNIFTETLIFFKLYYYLKIYILSINYQNVNQLKVLLF